MPIKIHKVHGRPYDIAEFHVTPEDVTKLFIIDEDFQRRVRSSSPMIAGIQKTLRDTHGLSSLLHVYQPKGNKRHVVVDGMHRLYALQTLGENIRCTIDAVRHTVYSENDAVRLFEQLNKCIPTSVQHLFRLQFDREHPTLLLLKERLPFSIVFGRWPEKDGPSNWVAPGSPTINQVVKWFTGTFCDIPRNTRFTVEETLDLITLAHVDALAELSLVFIEAVGVVNLSNKRYEDGWLQLLFGIWVQNQDLQLSADEWKTRIRKTMKNHRVFKYWDTPKFAMSLPPERNPILRALSYDRAPRMKFDAKYPPTIEQFQKAATGKPRVAKTSQRRVVKEAV